MIQLAQYFRACVRFLVLMISALVFIGLVLVGTFFSKNKTSTGLRIRAAYARFLCKTMQVKVELSGNVPSMPCIFIAAAHRSYFDPVAICSFVPAMPIAKAELADWPLIGYGCQISGVILVKREDRESRREALSAVGDAVLNEQVQALVFAEGTTHSLPQTIELRSGAFRLAAGSGIAIVPVAIDYNHAGAAFIGDDTFVGHFFRCFGRKKQRCYVRFGDPIQSSDGEFLLSSTKDFIDRSLLDFKQKMTVGKPG